MIMSTTLKTNVWVLGLMQAIMLRLGSTSKVPVPMFQLDVEQKFNRSNVPYLNLEVYHKTAQHNTRSFCQLKARRTKHPWDLYLYGTCIKVDTDSRGCGYSSIMRAIQILYTDYYLTSRHNTVFAKAKSYSHFEIVGMANVMAHWHHRFQVIDVGNDWKDYTYFAKEDSDKTTPLQGEAAVIQAFQDCHDSYDGSYKSEPRTALHDFLKRCHMDGSADAIPYDKLNIEKDEPLGFLMTMTEPVKNWMEEMRWSLEPVKDRIKSENHVSQTFNLRKLNIKTGDNVVKATVSVKYSQTPRR